MKRHLTGEFEKKYERKCHVDGVSFIYLSSLIILSSLMHFAFLLFQQLLVWKFTHWISPLTVVRSGSTAGIPLGKRSLEALGMDTSKSFEISSVKI